MKIFENARDVIRDAIKDEWHFLTKRADVPPLPVWLKLACSSYSEESKELYGVVIPWLGFWHGNEFDE